jgi:5'-3' exonuclease
MPLVRDTSTCKSGHMQVHLVDGTYELFRYYFATPSHMTTSGHEVAAVRGVLSSMLQLLEDGATHIGIATDHVIESFRNELWDDYKDGSGVEPDIMAQFPLLEDVLTAAGFAVWPMIEYEADDAMGAAAVKAAALPEVDEVIICTPDKDLAQVVNDETNIVQFDRRKGVRYDRAGVIEKFGVEPESIPDYLALVGDTADGFPGLVGWGAKSSSTVLARYKHVEDIPLAAGQWDITVRGGAKLANTLSSNLDKALLFRRIATLELEAPTFTDIDELRWTGPTEEFAEMAAAMDAERSLARIERLLAR